MSILKDDFKTLLPRNESKKSVDLDFLGADVISRISLEPLTLLPADTPPHLLKHLALMYGVNIDGLSEEEQRNLINRAFDIYRHLGTPYALKEALSVIGIDAEILEWYESEDELNPYNFGLKLSKMDSRGTNFILNYIQRFKNERSRLAKLTDGKCKTKAQLDISTYDNSVTDDVEGLIVDGVRVCFRDDVPKYISMDFSSIATTIYHSTKISYFFKSRYDNLRYDSQKEEFAISSSTNRYIDKKLTLKRSWLGAWVGNIADEYRPSATKSVSIANTISVEPSSTTSIYSLIDRESRADIAISKTVDIAKTKQLQRSWLGAWVGNIADEYAVVIA